MPKHLVIVESPAKAKTIKKFLGKEYDVEASMGHVRDLPSSTIAVDVDHDFEPEYEVPDEKKTVVKKLKDAMKKADDLWIATDGDREGEAIGWHLCAVLKHDPKKVNRIVFHEITETAIRDAVTHPRRIDMKLVDAQQARRVLDRLVGYTLSPFLWKKVYRGLSAGRVQSVAVRVIVDREREIKAFTAVEYWSVEALLENSAKQPFTAALSKKDGKKCEPGSEADVKQIMQDLDGAQYQVSSIEEKELKKTPPPPFTTSTLQQEAVRKLGFSVKQTMMIAQQLYEGVSLGKGVGHTGLITYMRTDSHNLSQKALDDAKRTIESHYGREYVLAEPRLYKKKVRGAQEAHEAIRPTELERIPASLEGVLDHQQLKLYTLIWNRTMATQMASAELKRVGVDVAANPASSAPRSAPFDFAQGIRRDGTTPRYTFRATGQTVVFDGFLRLYQEGRDEDHVRKEDDVDEGDKLLPPLTENEIVKLTEPLKTEQHFTKPPPRYTEASLVKKMEEEGIGRPSTYAPTISTIQQRGYIIKDGKQLVPQDVAFMVTDLLAEHFPDIVDLAFTAHMEQKLDHIAEGEETAPAFLKRFYGPFRTLVAKKTEEIQKKDVMKEREIGMDPKTGLPVVARIGRFGPYVQLGRFDPVEKNVTKAKKEAKPKLRSASLPKNISIDNVSLELALGLLNFPRELGAHDGNRMTVFLGRFGPYLKCGEVTTTLPKDRDPITITLSDAVALMIEVQEAKKKVATPLRTLGDDPMTGATILVKDGRFGPYVTDGKTNASLGKKRDPQTITLEEAADLLAKKRIRGPSKWRRRG